VRRYLELIAIQSRTALLLALQYRVDFFVQALMALFWTGTALMPLYVLFSMRDGVAGWTADEMLVVVGFFTVLKGALACVVQPSLAQAVDHIRKGTLDFVLLKPVDAQFMLSISKLELAHFTDVIGGFAIVAWAMLHIAGGHPTGLEILLSLLFLVCALAILYAVWILVVSLAFRVVKIDNMSHLFVALFEAARWPASVFRGALSLFFTFVIPLALMTTYPSLALLGRAEPKHVATALGVSAMLLALSRYVWKRSIGSYTSASS
jgi:ABC-2 type transport system permease protein